MESSAEFGDRPEGWRHKGGYKIVFTERQIPEEDFATHLLSGNSLCISEGEIENYPSAGFTFKTRLYTFHLGYDYVWQIRNGEDILLWQNPFSWESLHEE